MGGLGADVCGNMRGQVGRGWGRVLIETSGGVF